MRAVRGNAGDRGAARSDADAHVQIPEMSDIIITVFSARRRRQLDDRDSSLCG
jgi:hypothetical protein